MSRGQSLRQGAIEKIVQKIRELAGQGAHFAKFPPTLVAAP